jgi:hypothetical protein
VSLLDGPVTLDHDEAEGFCGRWQQPKTYQLSVVSRKRSLIQNRINKCARVVTLFGKVTQIQIISSKMIRSLFRPSA